MGVSPVTGNQSADVSAIVSPDRVREVVQAILRGAQAKGYTDEQLEGLSGVKARCIKSYRVENREPSLSHALSIGVALGLPALNNMLAIIGYAVRPLDEADELQANVIVARGMQHLSVIADAAADGRIDHLERPTCQEAADMLIATVLPLSSAGQAA